MASRLHAVIVPEWYPSPGDPVAGVFIRDQARAAAQRCDITVLAPASAEAPPEYDDEGVRTVRLPTRRGPRRFVALSKLRDLDSAIARLRREGRAPDVIHAHFFSAGFLSVLVGQRRRLPVVVSEHLSDVQEECVGGWDAAVARFTYRHARLVCPASYRLERSLLRLEPKANSVVVDNPVDIDLFADSARDRPGVRGQRLLTVARLVEKKGLADLLAAMRYVVVDYPDVTLEVVGDGIERSRLETMASGLPVTFVGAQPKEAVAGRMTRADVLVIPSRVETFGITAIEGLAAGLRVIATSACPTADAVAAAGGIVTPPSDPARLADALRSALDGAPRPNSNVVNELRQRYGLEAAGRRWETIYRAVSTHGAATSTTAESGTT